MQRNFESVHIFLIFVSNQSKQSQLLNTTQTENGKRDETADNSSSLSMELVCADDKEEDDDDDNDDADSETLSTGVKVVVENNGPVSGPTAVAVVKPDGETEHVCNCSSRGTGKV